MSDRMLALEDLWASLCDDYLPSAAPGDVWRSSRTKVDRDLSQGWKLHVSATILNACEVFGLVAPLLRRMDVLFKAPASLLELKKINTGLYYGYSQIGKFITIYPQSTDDAVEIAHQLDRGTRGRACPQVPSDLPLRPGSCVFYRYGAFEFLLPEGGGDSVNDDSRLMIRAPSGELVPDLRRRATAIPSWETNPFRQSGTHANAMVSGTTPLMTTYRTYAAISQRGKGGVYRAIDLRFAPARHCVIKEGRSHGETDWDGQDGFARVQNEKRVLERLAAHGAAVPGVLDYFEVGQSNFLVLESVAGEVLQTVISEGGRLPAEKVLLHAVRIAELMRDIHAAGVVWRDCKPLNILVEDGGALRAIDFEGACLEGEIPEEPWGTSGYAPPEWPDRVGPDLRLQDLYALGATLRQMLTGQIPGVEASAAPAQPITGEVSASLAVVVDALTDPDPDARPSAETVAEWLRGRADIGGRGGLERLRDP
jgi:hypothetical protein